MISTSKIRRVTTSSTVLLGILATIAAQQPAHAKLETWRQETASAFTKGKRDHVVISDNGRIRLAQELKPAQKIDALRVWDLARTNEGVTYAATGDAGKVFRREGKDDAAWAVAYDADDTQALALAVLDG